jgi:hypothetical protein
LIVSYLVREKRVRAGNAPENVRTSLTLIKRFNVESSAAPEEEISAVEPCMRRINAGSSAGNREGDPVLTFLIG